MSTFLQERHYEACQFIYGIYHRKIERNLINIFNQGKLYKDHGRHLHLT